ncbi:MAG: hypothetical protein ABFC84_17390 [Veillonellales bacterium]
MTKGKQGEGKTEDDFFMLTNLMRQSSEKQQSLGRLQLLSFQNTIVDLFVPAKCQMTSGAALVDELHRQVISSCLYNPFWNDFRLQHSLEKKRFCITLEEVRQIKQQYQLDNRDVLCNLILQLANRSNVPLNRHQLSFVEKVKPELRDFDLRQENPGELLVYQCLFSHNMKGIGRIYLHLYADLYNGHIFGRLTHGRTLDEGLRVFRLGVLPVYRTGDLRIEKVMYSSRQPEHPAGCFSDDFAKSSSHWIHTCRSFGIFEQLQRSLLQSESLPRAASREHSLSFLQEAFSQWLKQYNFKTRRHYFSCL